MFPGRRFGVSPDGLPVVPPARLRVGPLGTPSRPTPASYPFADLKSTFCDGTVFDLIRRAGRWDGYPLFDVTSGPNTPGGNFTKTEVLLPSEANAYRVGLTYFDINSGTVLIDWEPADPAARVREGAGQVVLQQRVAPSPLRAKPEPQRRCETDTPLLIAAHAAHGCVAGVSSVYARTLTAGRVRRAAEPRPHLARDSG